MDKGMKSGKEVEMPHMDDCMPDSEKKEPPVTFENIHIGRAYACKSG